MTYLEEHPPRWKEEIPDEILLPPSNLDSDEPPLESDLHRQQIDLLIRLLQYWWRDRQDFYISGNLTVYYNTEQLKTRDFRGPDVFVVLGTEKKDRRSWTIWDEGGRYPNVVIELLSSSTAKVDKGAKKTLYQDIWRLPEYYWFDPHSLELAGFRLVEGRYQEIPPDSAGYLPSEQLGLKLGIHAGKLRWFTAEGQLIPLPEEAERQRAEQEYQRAEQERRAKEQLQQQLEQAKAFLRSQGWDPDQL
ncbi:Uma2 family endonuclease [Thermostichus vulcanus]|uniref:Uma2 family endonuclease n=1 Tax=Thermostichus vulcanus str. 'Rupite' TaxID=2813851 RepID=A0ABT0CBP3_THEVL|nr:Uma2 family endonuclease [Thermostichus vulcanus]MCJ2542785.1 Uma2 family endonuclease [Thermostichus vulcanus str. 'Rupite']